MATERAARNMPIMVKNDETRRGLWDLSRAHRILNLEGHNDMSLGHCSMRDPWERGVWLKRGNIGLEEVHEQMRRRHYSLRTEEAYAHWIKRFIWFSGKRHPRVLGEAEQRLVGGLPRAPDEQLGERAVARGVVRALPHRILRARDLRQERREVGPADSRVRDLVGAVVLARRHYSPPPSALVRRSVISPMSSTPMARSSSIASIT